MDTSHDGFMDIVRAASSSSSSVIPEVHDSRTGFRCCPLFICQSVFAFQMKVMKPPVFDPLPVLSPSSSAPAEPEQAPAPSASVQPLAPAEPEQAPAPSASVQPLVPAEPEQAPAQNAPAAPVSITPASTKTLFLDSSHFSPFTARSPSPQAHEGVGQAHGVLPQVVITVPLSCGIRVENRCCPSECNCPVLRTLSRNSLVYGLGLVCSRWDGSSPLSLVGQGR
jgi:hypothetical protein